MDSFRLAFEVVFPLFVMMAVGYVIKLLGWVDDALLTRMNTVTFRVFLSVLVFMNIYNSDISEVFSAETLRLILFAWGCVIVFIFALMFGLKKRYPEIRRRTIMTQGIYRGNLVLFGIPVASTIGGPEASAKAAVLIATVVPLFNLSAVVLLERARSRGADLKAVVLKIFKNPLIIASLLGFFFGICRIRIPEVVLSPLQSLANVGTPLSFVILGGTLNFRKLAGDIRPLMLVCVGKLILVPGIVFLLAFLFGFQKLELVALLGAMASPTAVSSFSMAKEMGVDGDFAGQIVILTSVLALFTIFCWVAGLGSAGLI